MDTNEDLQKEIERLRDLVCEKAQTILGLTKEIKVLQEYKKAFLAIRKYVLGK